MSKYKDKLIVSADDFGTSPEANKNILTLVRLGKVDRLALLIDGYFTQSEIIKLLNSRVKMDIHLNFEFYQSTKRRAEEGVIRRLFRFFGYYFLGKISREKIEESWKKQIEKFRDIIGKNPDGINSHQYLHFSPPYFKVILELARKFNIHYIRFGRKGIIKSRNNVAKILNLLYKKNKKTFYFSRLESSDFLISLDWVKDFPQFLKKLPDGQTEIVCHPEREEEFKIIKTYL